MKYKTVTVTTNHNDADLVASALFEAGAGGVTILDKQDFYELIKSDVIWDYVDENVISGGDEVKVSATVEYEDKPFVRNLESLLENLRERGGITYSEITETITDEADYENEWKKYYHPIVTSKITIVPTWIKYDKYSGERVMRLDPGMAFGTGEHATTRMCLELMDVEGKSVIDVGCGSGILGIAAKICGAKEVYMCDIDPQAVAFAKKNAELNGIDAVIEKADLIEGGRKSDVIIANITADILMRFAKSIGEHLNPDGEIILSGIIDSRLNEAEKRYVDCGFEIVERTALDDWRAMKLRRR